MSKPSEQAKAFTLFRDCGPRESQEQKRVRSELIKKQTEEFLKSGGVVK